MCRKCMNGQNSFDSMTFAIQVLYFLNAIKKTQYYYYYFEKVLSPTANQFISNLFSNQLNFNLTKFNALICRMCFFCVEESIKGGLTPIHRVTNQNCGQRTKMAQGDSSVFKESQINKGTKECGESLYQVAAMTGVSGGKYQLTEGIPTSQKVRSTIVANQVISAPVFCCYFTRGRVVFLRIKVEFDSIRFELNNARV